MAIHFTTKRKRIFRSGFFGGVSGLSVTFQNTRPGLAAFHDAILHAVAGCFHPQAGVRRAKKKAGEPGDSSRQRMDRECHFQEDLFAHLVEGEIEFENINARLAEETEIAAFGLLRNERTHLLFSNTACFGNGRRLVVGVIRRDIGIEA